MESSFDSMITPAMRQKVDGWLADLPGPILLLHPRGVNFWQQKSIPEDVQKQLIKLLLDQSDCSIVVLNWDCPTVKYESGRVRYLKPDFGHLDILELAALYERASLLCGIDSGPYHLASMTRLPALGVFHQFYPSCVSLPRASRKNAVMVPKRYGGVNVWRRKRWGTIEYAADMPTAEDIARHALRMLAGPRYGLPAGRDALLQHLVRDRARATPPGHPTADRDKTFDVLFREMKKFKNPQVAETGCVRSAEDWSAGYSSYLFGCYLEGRGAGCLTSVDLDRANCETARFHCKDWSDHLNLVGADSVAYLSGRAEPIDVLYLDSLDADQPGHQEHCLAEIQAAYRLLGPDSLVLIDDTTWAGGWRGKGAKAVPWLICQGWRIMTSGYQVLLSRLSIPANLSAGMLV
ncbi:hypothetical protein FRUB_07001 [Fimbriiglobus ruber]|uniref:Uncharacterized protein n=2 Tax=Fimbriiglobus ruber TaxID=1908690 RepID=A0A225D8K6_9BACT|nr:hypothetical protein FRUB_07001 [Fimbriiglobus ruber]